MVVNDDFSQQDIEFHRATAAWYDDETTSEFNVYHRYLLEPFLDRVAADLGAVRALDLGCGPGVVSLALAERGFDVLGIDHSVEMLGVAKAKLVRAHDRGRWRFVLGEVRNVPAGDGEFGCVTCQGLLHHLPEMAKCLSELERVLKPVGTSSSRSRRVRRRPLSACFGRSRT